MKDTTRKDIVKMKNELFKVERRLEGLLEIDEPEVTIKDAREFGYLSLAVSELRTILTNLEVIRNDFYLKDEEK